MTASVSGHHVGDLKAFGDDTKICQLPLCGTGTSDVGSQNHHIRALTTPPTPPHYTLKIKVTLLCLLEVLAGDILIHF